MGPEESKGDLSEGDINLSPRWAEWIEKNLDEETRKILEEDSRLFLHQSLSTPCLDVLKSCDGIHLENLQGRRLMDFHGNNVHQVGFSHPRVLEAVKDQLDKLSFCTRRYTNLPAIELARTLSDRAPGDLDRVLLCPGGTGAMGMALKLARCATGRYKTISMWDSFHGASLDTISIGGEALFRAGMGPLLSGAEHVPPPDSYRCAWDCGGECNLKCADYIDYVLEKEGDVAAVVAETVRSTPFIPSADYWKQVRESCDRHGALLILDEIPHCLGRTGRMFTCEHYGVVPDMLVIGKGLGGGVFPLAALIAREGLNVAADKALGHYTHEKSPVACAAALAAIDVIEDEKLLQNATRIGKFALERLAELERKHALVGDVRGLGLLLGVELVRDRQSRERATEEAEVVMYEALARGLSFKLTMGNILTLTPALTITEEEMAEAIGIIDECLSLVC
ncbi:MAG: aspartate aminotransferase family protein [Planctomycetota bacterium]|nr:aspartate aminotransferase family protein [Planctomycetota bacterium]